jgi:hypothetical protein
MATNLQNTPNARQNNRPGDAQTDTVTTSGMNSTGVGSVAVFDQDADGTTTSTSTMRPSASMVDDRSPAEVRTGGSMVSWIIGAIVLIVLAYFLLQMLF